MSLLLASFLIVSLRAAVGIVIPLEFFGYLLAIAGMGFLLGGSGAFGQRHTNAVAVTLGVCVILASLLLVALVGLGPAAQQIVTSGSFRTGTPEFIMTGWVIELAILSSILALVLLLPVLRLEDLPGRALAYVAASATVALSAEIALLTLPSVKWIFTYSENLVAIRFNEFERNVDRLLGLLPLINLLWAVVYGVPLWRIHRGEIPALESPPSKEGKPAAEKPSKEKPARGAAPGCAAGGSGSPLA